MGKPTIRFEGYTDDWEQRKLGNVLLSLQNNTLSRANLSDESGIAKNVHYGDVLIKFGEVLDVRKEKLPMITDENVLSKYKASFLQNGDVIVADTAEDSTVGKCSEIAGLNDEVVLSGLHTIPYRPIEKFASGYLGYYLNSGAYHNQLIPLMQGIKVTSISKSAMQDTDIDYPKSQEEQGKIGAYFKFLDEMITLHHRKCEETKKLKKFMLQKMFPKKGKKVPDIRFDGFTDDWEQRKLGEVCEIKDSARIPNSEWSETGVPYIRASDVTNENTDGVLFISQERYEFYKNRTGVPTKDDVLFNGGGEIGKSLLITDKKPIYVQGGAVLYARTSKSRELVGQYLKTYFETTNAKSYVDTASAGGTMRHFTLKPSQMMRILMPSVEEQEKIGEYFANLDHLITLHQHKCEELQNIKKFMLQNMFT